MSPKISCLHPHVDDRLMTSPLHRGYFEELLHTITRAKHGLPTRRRLARNFSSRPELIEEAQSSSLVHETSRIKPRPGFRYPQAGLASLYALGTKPPLSSYSALAHRMNLPASMRDDLGLIEQCCTCPSFWEEVIENQEELKHILPPKERLTYFQDRGQTHNMALSSVGNEILGMLAAEWVSHRWPHLPLKCVCPSLAMYLAYFWSMAQRHESSSHNVCRTEYLLGYSKTMGHPTWNSHDANLFCI